jgi:hypothetical protein
VAEIFRVLAGELDDPETLKLIGAVSTEKRWCYPEWVDVLAGSPRDRAALPRSVPGIGHRQGARRRRSLTGPS